MGPDMSHGIENMRVIVDVEKNPFIGVENLKALLVWETRRRQHLRLFNIFAGREKREMEH